MLVMKKSSVSRTQKVYVFSDFELCLGKIIENLQSNVAWEDRLMWFKSSSERRALDTIDGEPTEFEWNIFPGFTTLQLCNRVQEFLSNMSTEPEDFTGRTVRSHFGSRAISCSSVHGVFSRSRAFLVLSWTSVYNPILLFPTSSHDTCERRNKCADVSGTSLFFEFGVS